MRRRAFLDHAESAALEVQVASLEAQTGIQLVVAVIGKADSYVELPWKAFALGAALAGLAVVAADWLRPDWLAAADALIDAAVILGAGAVSASLAVVAPPYARLFLSATRRDLEVRHYAQAFFLRRELFGTRGRNGLLILVSLFERRVEVLPDAGLQARFGEAEWRGVIDGMTPQLRERRCFGALQQAVARVQAMLLEKGLAASPGGNELPDRPIQESGAR